MKTVVLTRDFIEEAQPLLEKDRVIIDRQARHLAFVIKPNGQKWFAYIDKTKRKSRRTYIGNALIMPISKARTVTANMFEVSMGSALTTGKSPFAFFVKTKYLPHIVQHKRSARTEKNFIDKYLLPAWSNYKLEDITELMCASLLAKYRQTHSPASADRFLSVMRMIFNKAIDWQVGSITKNPAADIAADNVDTKKERFLTLNEIQRLIKAAGNCRNRKLSRIVQFLILTGSRKSEVLNARWADVDFKNAVLTIWRNKSNKIHRIPLSNQALDLLRRLPRDTEYIFGNPRTRKPYKNFYTSWQEVCRKAKLQGLRIHDLRHSFASILVNAGKNLYDVQKILGHSNPNTTQRYAHLCQERLAEHVDYVGNLLGDD